jgi:hypothetical protein
MLAQLTGDEISVDINRAKYEGNELTGIKIKRLRCEILLVT